MFAPRAVSAFVTPAALRSIATSSVGVLLSFLTRLQPVNIEKAAMIRKIFDRKRLSEKYFIRV